jgi:uncharacterized protein (TIGR03435 family)
MMRKVFFAGLTLPIVAILVATAHPSAQINIPPGARSDAPDPGKPLYFEAASVKVNKDGGPGRRINRAPGGRFTAVNVPASLLITFAWQIQPYQLVDLPKWAGEEAYDIVAKIEGDPAPVQPPNPDHMMLATRTLLADRFKLKLHTETRQMDIYQLVMAKPGGSPGPALKPANDECGQMNAGRGGRQGPPPTRPDGTPVICGMIGRAGQLRFNGMPLSEFAKGLAGQVGRFVVDRTGLTGEWMFDLTYQARLPPNVQLPPGVEPPAVDPNVPDLFTAIQEQLGLKLESVKGPVEVMVVDSIDHPIAD